MSNERKPVRCPSCNHSVTRCTEFGWITCNTCCRGWRITVRTATRLRRIADLIDVLLDEADTSFDEDG